MKIQKTFFYILIILSVTGLFICSYGIINTMVSLKYETENITDCISLVSGENLCITIRNLKVLFITCLIILILLLYFKKGILKLKEKQ